MAEGDSEISFPRGIQADMENVTSEEEHMNQAEEEIGDYLGQGDQTQALQYTPSTAARNLQFYSNQQRAHMVIRPETFEGKEDWADYISHFSDCAELGEWDDRNTCLVLAAQLRGAARKFYNGLSLKERKSYEKLVTSLRRRFGSENRQESWSSKLEMRRRKPGESIADLGDDIWRLTQRAYCNFDHRSQEQLALKHFYRVIESDMKVKCIENKCSNVPDAVDVVERYESLLEDRKEHRKTV